MEPFGVVKDFEAALCEYTGARYAVTTNSCTNALLLACVWHRARVVHIPKWTYVGVAQSILHAGGRVHFTDERWVGGYQLAPFPIWDYARRFTSNMYRPGEMHCVSFHYTKILNISRGGAILHDDDAADRWFRAARFDGRTEGVHPKNDKFIRGWHCMMMPEVAAAGLVRLHHLPRRNDDLPTDDYPDLSKQAIFK